ncbi:MAG: DUF1361 domain-containing protein [Aureispira sp.]
MIKNWKNKWTTPQELLFCMVLTILVLFNFSLTALRVYHTEQLYFVFLVWNLFLALLPWVGVKTAEFLQQQGTSTVWVVAFLGATIAFLPNAPYLLTDLYHLRWTSYSTILWLDTLMIVAYATTGLVGFYATLFVLEKILEQYWGKLWTSFALVVLFFLNGFGVYLGRFLRFNSWDVLADPWALWSVITERLLDPMEHPRTWGVTLGYGGLFLLGFYGLKLWKFSLLKQHEAVVLNSISKEKMIKK